MKKVLLGGFIFVGGAVLFSIGTLGLADINVQAQYMQAPRYLGVIVMLAGLALGLWGLKDER